MKMIISIIYQVFFLLIKTFIAYRSINRWWKKGKKNLFKENRLLLLQMGNLKERKLSRKKKVCHFQQSFKYLQFQCFLNEKHDEKHEINIEKNII